MATHCQTAARSGSGERQNIGAVDSFEGREGGRSTSFLAPNKFGFRGRWSATAKNRGWSPGWSKKTQGRTALKNGGASLAVGSYLQRGSAPPPPPGI